MLLLPAILLVALLAGLVLGGRPRNIAARRIRLWWLAPVGLAFQLSPVPDLDAASERLLSAGILVGSYALILAVALANIRQPGFALIALGFAMNILVIAPNRGMPVSAEALRAAGAPGDIAVLQRAEGKHHLATKEDVLRPLGDVIGLPAPFRVVVSVGDLIGYAGAGLFVAVAMVKGPRREDWSGMAPRPQPAKRSGTRRSHGRHRPASSRS